ncbi:MAG: hypothetical protein MJH11_05075 [Lentisphaeria bacterium]|nr:hypothetical protein [Lentisphaeria bacterium]
MKKNRQRRGSALILSMGLLIVLLVFMLSFSVMAVYNQRSAKQSEDIIQTRIHTETGLQQAYMYMANEWSEPSVLENRFPASKYAAGSTDMPFGLTISSANWSNRYYWTSLSNDTSGLALAFYVSLAGEDITPDDSSGLLSTVTGWNPILDNDGFLVARVAYLIIDESGKIDPTAVVKEDEAEGTETGLRTGADVTEIDLTAALNDAFAAKFQYSGTGTGQLPIGSRWFSRFNMIKQNTSSSSNMDELLQILFPYSRDIEAFYDGVIDKHRFDMTKTLPDDTSVWDGYANDIVYDETTTQSYTVDDLTVIVNTSCPILTDPSDYWADSETVNANSGGIPWINNILNDTVKNKLCANIIDFCDTDSVATTDNSDNPTYVGLEKVPYINEIHFQASIELNADGINYDFILEVTPEVINIYGDDLTGGTLTIEIIANSDLGSTDTLEFSFDVGAVSAQSYKTLTSETVDVNIGSNATMGNFYISVNYAKINVAGEDDELEDFAFSDVVETITTPLADGSTKMITIEVNDPRFNLESSEWEWTPGGWDTLAVGTIDTVNSICLPDPNIDGEDAIADDEEGATEPWVSTAFIPNRAPQNFWEIGAIFRAIPWQTVNLSVFNEDSISTTGMAEYYKGDANLLDQLKMTEEDVNIGTININTYNTNVIEALLTGIPLGGTYAAPTGTGTNLTEDIAALIAETAGTMVAGDWLFENGSTNAGGVPFGNRGELAKITNLFNSLAYDPHTLTQDTDAAKEEIIGKIVNLCTTRATFYTVIVIAQGIKELRDADGTVLGGTKGQFDDTDANADGEYDYDRVLAEQKIMVILRRDSFTNKFDVLRYEYLDE